MNKNDARKIPMARLISIAAMLLAPFATAWSQPFGLDPEAPDPVLIEFRAEAGRGDFVGRAEGLVESGGKRFYLKGIDVMAPLVLQVLAEDPARPIEVSLHRLLWEEDDWRGRTDQNGNWGYVGRVYEDVGIELTATEKTGFYVLAWQGPAVTPTFGLTALAPSSVSGSPRVEDSSGGGLMIVLAAAVVVLTAAAILFRRRARGGASSISLLATAWLLTLLTGASKDAVAQGAAIDPAGLDARLFAAELRITEMNESLSSALQGIETASEATFRNFDMIVENWEEIMQLGIQQQEFAAEMQSQVEALRAEMQRKDRQHDRLIRRLETLIEEDREAEPDPTLGGAVLDSSCPAGGSEEPGKCGRCFKDANTRLAQRLEWMERARILYDTNKSMVDRSVGAGDARSGWHQLEQAEWYGQKLKIQGAFRQNRAAYDEFLGRAYPDLIQILKSIEVCEAEAGGIPNWFERRGQLFYTIIKARFDRD